MHECRAKKTDASTYVHFLLFLVIGLIAGFVIAAEQVRAEEGGAYSESTLLSGLVIDSTVTGVGHEFARLLAKDINTNFPGFDYNLIVRERPSARWGSVIWVTKDNNKVYETVLYPGRSDFSTLSEQAASQITKTIRTQSLQSLFAHDADLLGDGY